MRDFLKILGGSALADPLHGEGTCAPERIKGTDRPRCAVIGLGNRGRGMAEWQIPPFADVLAVCDVDARKLAPVAEAVRKRTGRAPQVYTDYRRILDREDIDFVANATPTHWHAKIVVDACRAGKDVYSEKPLAYNVHEGQVMRKIVAETGRIVQIGTQQRSGIHFRIVCDLVRHGRIGKLKQIAVILPGPSMEHGGPCVAEPVPPELDWDMWSGPAPLHPFCSARLRPSAWSDYGGGLITEWGVHHMDIAHWAMGGEEVAPSSIEGWGYCPNLGKPGYPDQFRPFAARLEYPGGVELWFMSEVPTGKDRAAEGAEEIIQRVYGRLPENIRNYKAPDPEGGVWFIGENGSVFVGRQGVVAEGIGEVENMPLPPTQHLRWRLCLYEHTRNFVECVASRRRPVSYVAEQHRTHLPCHLTNIALRLGRKVRWDGQREVFLGDAEANAMLRRPQERSPYQLTA